MRNVCSDLINQLVQEINSKNTMKVKACLVGSGARNLETQNEQEPIDLDYNLIIVKANFDINNCREIKEYVRKEFNRVLKRNNWGDCQDSTFALSTEYRHFTTGNNTCFKIDLGIIYDNKDAWYRLIHNKTGVVDNDSWIWNMGANSQNLNKKVEYIKKNYYWEEVRRVYLEKKNLYLIRRDYNHPSFNCYIEAINEIYYAKGGK